MEIDVHVSLYGENFSPALLEARTGLRLVEKKELNELGPADKYRAKPVPYGAATLRLQPPTNEYGPQMDALLSTLEVHAKVIRQCGAERVVVWVVVYAHNGDQRNLEFNPTTMARLSSLDMTLAISNYTKE